MSGFVVLADRDASEAVWLAARAEKITATDVAKIMTSGPGGWAELHRAKRYGAKFRGNRYTEWGHEREPLILAHLAATHGLNPNSQLLGSLDDPRFAATPDAISGDGTLLGEAKTTLKDWPDLDGSLESFSAAGHADYWWQMVCQMYVTGASLTAFAYELHEDFVPVWFEPRVVLVDRDDAAVELMLARVAEWEAFDWEGTDAPDGLDALLSERALLAEAVAAAQGRLDAATAEVRALVEGHGKPLKFEGSAGSVSWSGKPVSSTRFDSTAFKKADPDRWAEFAKTTESQPRLTFTTRS